MSSVCTDQELVIPACQLKKLKSIIVTQRMVESKDAHLPKWEQIKTRNRIGNRPTINRCLLLPYPISTVGFTDQFIVLGCHFTRNEIPFTYDTTLNQYSY